MREPSQRPDPAALGISLGWLLRLRWALLLAGALAIGLSERALHVALPRASLLALIALGAVVNAALGVARPAPARAIGALLVVDLLLLTASLYLTGGVYNPFVLGMVVPVILATVTLGRRAGVRMGAAAVLSVAVLAVAHRPLAADHQHAPHLASDHDHGRELDSRGHLRVHAEGMWLAFAVLAALFVYLMSWALRQRDLQLRALSADKAKADKLAELGAVAAYAAHELGGPLTAIAVLAKELERALEQTADADALSDARAIRAEVERCRRVLDDLASQARSEQTAPAPVSLAELLASARELAREPARVRIEVDEDLAAAAVMAPRMAIAHVLRGVLANALEASPAREPVRVSAHCSEGRCRIEVRDRGPGMSPGQLARAGQEPMTSGTGLGIGLYLGRAILERVGGELALSSSEGEGTCVTLTLPLAEAR